jgi:hypothetical protein
MGFTVACLLQPACAGAPPHTTGMVRRRTAQSSGICPQIRGATSAPAAVRPAPPAARASFHLVRPLDSPWPNQARIPTRSPVPGLLRALSRLLYGVQPAQPAHEHTGFPNNLFVLELYAHHGRPVVFTATRHWKRQLLESAAAIPIRAALGTKTIAHRSIITAPSIRVPGPGPFAWTK